MVMARKEVLVQLDDELVAQLDELATLLDLSRSELLRRGAAAILEAHRLVEADEALAAAYRRLPQDPLFTEALNTLAGSTGPPW